MVRLTQLKLGHDSGQPCSEEKVVSQTSKASMLSRKEEACYRHHFYFISSRYAEAFSVIRDVLTTYEAENAEWIAIHADEIVKVEVLRSVTSVWSAMRTTFPSKASRIHFTKAIYRASEGFTRSTGGHDFIDTRQPARSGLYHQPGMPVPEHTVLRQLSSFVRKLRLPTHCEENEVSALDVTFAVGTSQESCPNQQVL